MRTAKIEVKELTLTFTDDAVSTNDTIVSVAETIECLNSPSGLLKLFMPFFTMKKANAPAPEGEKAEGENDAPSKDAPAFADLTVKEADWLQNRFKANPAIVDGEIHAVRLPPGPHTAKTISLIAELAKKGYIMTIGINEKKSYVSISFLEKAVNYIISWCNKIG